MAMLTIPPRPKLSEAQKTAILSSAAEMIAAAASDRTPVLTDPTLGGAAEVPLGGVFVSLKRDKHLRGCTGGLRTQPVKLGAALADAAESTVLRDQRFPIISQGEVPYLDLELWLLYNPQPIHCRGDDRIRAVITGGKHGLVVSRGQAHGLLLPGVAKEHGWDSKQFLEHVCQKAGMHPSLWKDDQTSLMTFEGDPLDAYLGDYLDVQSAPPIIDRGELEAYFDFCWNNIVSLFEGRTVHYFNPSLRDFAVSGINLRLRPPGGQDPIQITSLALRGGPQIQNTLVQFAQAGAQQLANRGIRLETLGTVGMGLTFFADPHIHGTVEHHDLRGFDPASRAIVVIDRTKQGILFHPEQSAEDSLRDAVKMAHVSTPASAGVFSLQTVTTDKSVSIAMVPQPKRGPAERPPAVAGAFYPSDPAQLNILVEGLLSQGKPKDPPRAVPAAMVPHAGLKFSGAIAARVLQSLVLPKTIIILGPKHTNLGMDWAVAPQQTWQIPGAEIASDFMLARRLCNAVPGLQLDSAAHEREHAIEVELPFLAKLAPESRVLGVALGMGDWPAAQRFAERLAELIKELPEPPLLLISSDMNHFATDAENRRLDEIALKELESLKPEQAFKAITEQNISMCGVFPAAIVMETLRLLGKLKKATRCGYATSADVTGEKDRVVGYAGMLFE